MMREALIATLVLVATCSSALAETNIETKYLMFKIDDIDAKGLDGLAQKKKASFILGKSVTLDNSKVELLSSRRGGELSRVLKVLKSIRVNSVTFNPGCELHFTEASKETYELVSTNCEDGSIEYEGVRIKANYSSFDSLTRNHFYASELTADSKIPLPNGKFLYPGDKINVVEWAVVAPTNRFKLEKK